MKTKRLVYGKSPNGGVLTALLFKAKDGSPTTEELAESVEIVEYNSRGIEIFRTYGQSRTPAQA